MPVSTTATPDPGSISVRAWRRRSPALESAPGVSLGEMPLGADAGTESARIYEQGVRAISIEDQVDLTTAEGAEAAIWTLALIRELTSHGIEVRWRLSTGSAGPPLVALSHLYPPSELLGGVAGALAEWQAGFYLGRCFYRQGPKFIQVRDHRYGELHRFTIDEPEYLEAIRTLTAGGPAVRDISTEIVADFENEGLVVRVGDTPWWAPYRLRRWPLSCWSV